jgi:hypothetical protein
MLAAKLMKNIHQKSFHLSRREKQTNLESQIIKYLAHQFNYNPNLALN